MASSTNIVDTQADDEVIISNTGSHFGGSADAEKSGADLGRALELTTILQSTLDMESLFQLFAREVKKHIACAGIHYTNAQIDVAYEFGSEARHKCHYRLIVGSQKLGELTVFRGVAFSEKETVTLEYLLSALLYPLRNAILYLQALQTALTDPLTGINNRAAFASCIQRELDLANRHKTPFSLLIADIDHFKKLNDTYGHLYGDCVLREVAQKIQQCIRSTDMVFRYGGEEFAILLSNTPYAGANLTAERIRFAIAKKLKKSESNAASVTISIGGAELREDDTSISLFKRADAALYQAKNAGRNCVCFDAAQPAKD